MESVVLPEANQSQDGKFGNFYCVLKNVFQNCFKKSCMIEIESFLN